MLDIKGIRVALFSGLSAYLGITMIRKDQTGPAPAYPYGTGKATTPASANNGTWQRHDDGIDRMMVSSIWSLSFLSDDYDQSVMLASRAREWITNSGHVWLSERGIAVQSVTNIANRDNILTVDYENNHGFDVVLYVWDEKKPAEIASPAEMMETIEEVAIRSNLIIKEE